MGCGPNGTVIKILKFFYLPKFMNGSEKSTALSRSEVMVKSVIARSARLKQI